MQCRIIKAHIASETSILFKTMKLSTTSYAIVTWCKSNLLAYTKKDKAIFYQSTPITVREKTAQDLVTKTVEY